jgi:hypothetical protein
MNRLQSFEAQLERLHEVKNRKLPVLNIRSRIEGPLESSLRKAWLFSSKLSWIEYLFAMAG